MTPPESPDNNDFTRLGFMSFDPNERTQFSARELKSVSLPDVEASSLRFTFHRCHANALNTHGQIGIIMLNIVGEPLLRLSPRKQSRSTPPVRTPPPAVVREHIGFDDDTVTAAAAAILDTAAGLNTNDNDINITTKNTQQQQQQHRVPVPPLPLVPGSNNVPLNSTQQHNQQQEPYLVPSTTSTSSTQATAQHSAHGDADSMTASKIQQLQQLKAAAVQIEDYDEAKRLKVAIEKLSVAGSQIAALERKKIQAVSIEDYDTAKKLKEEIDVMRRRVYNGGMPRASLGGGDNTDGGGDALGHGPPRTDVGIDSATANGYCRGGPTTITTTMTSSVGIASDTAALDEVGRKSGPRDVDPLSPHSVPRLSSPTYDRERQYDERSARASGSYALDAYEAVSLSPGDGDAEPSPPLISTMEDRRIATTAADTMSRRSGSDASAMRWMLEEVPGTIKEDPAAPAGFPPGLPSPDLFSSLDLSKDCDVLIQIFGEYLVRCLYGKVWQLRDAAMRHIGECIVRDVHAVPSLNGNADALRMLGALITAGLKDRIPAVVNSSMVLLRAIFASSSSRGFSSREIHAVLTDAAPLIVEKAADGSSRSRDQAMDTLVTLANSKDSGLHAMTAVLLSPIKKGELARTTLGRVQLVTTLLPLIGVSSSLSGIALSSMSSPSSSSCRFEPATVMKFVAPALISASAEVRAAAVELTLKLGVAAGGDDSDGLGNGGAMLGESLMQMLPSGINPKLREQIDIGLTGGRSVVTATTRATEDGGHHKLIPEVSKERKSDQKERATTTSSSSSKNAAATVAKRKSSTVARSGDGGGVLSRRNSAVPPATAAIATAPAKTSSSNGKNDGGGKDDHQPRRKTSASAHRGSASSSAPIQPQQQLLQHRMMMPHVEDSSAMPRGDGPARPTTSQHQAAVRKSYQELQEELVALQRMSAQHQQSMDQHRIPPSIAPQQMQIQQHQQDSIPSPPAIDAIAEEDPAPFERELAAREAALGPTHPDVAEAASNLAILYNQRGDSARALPLYQRALSIWERAYGPEHSEVAHALTDIAVILLESGRDDDGKVLLRRALVIQEKLLGYDHPDVVAIRDVLLE